MEIELLGYWQYKQYTDNSNLQQLLLLTEDHKQFSWPWILNPQVTFYQGWPAVGWRRARCCCDVWTRCWQLPGIWGQRIMSVWPWPPSYSDWPPASRASLHSLHSLVTSPAHQTNKHTLPMAFIFNLKAEKIKMFFCCCCCFCVNDLIRKRLLIQQC